MSAVTASFPVRRQDFGFDEVPRHWVDTDPFMTHLFNALSALFPDGERFFVASVRAVRDQVKDPQLQKDISAFIGQEAMHAKEHGHFNEGAIHQGFDIKKLEGWTRGFLSAKNLPLLNSKRTHLAATVALEHFTGILSAQLLKREDLVHQIDSSMRNLWAWHCIEENEHKAVAFDTYREIYGDGALDHAIRAGVMVLVTVLVLTAIHSFVVELMREDKQLANVRSWTRGLGRVWGRRGLFTAIIPEYLDYFRPGFHPWDHDTNFLLRKWRKEIGIM
ncbi:metal-dependent hydrolase [Marinobacter sp. TBZ242]|uniref:Metal-dependent hydrolase n=1 Tax=Marinobacter azerbaijanicus TaxID=3050455 RepID=A0ABT7IEP4_9GAMM|nr:metal-dependent hydrolase [Marinobacter sp. TBZ242]MDL0432207.1 metal-dependent hydrolase [Marinobacter sp. TBZ242]